MIVVPVRVVILHRVPISTHNIFYNPLYSPKPLQILQILQILQSYRHLTDNVPAHFVHRTIVQPAQGPRYFFVHLAQVAASLRSAGAGNRAAGGRGEFRGRRAASRAHACKLRENLGGGVGWRVSWRRAALLEIWEQASLEIWAAGRLESFVAAIWKSGGVRSGGPLVAGRRLEI